MELWRKKNNKKDLEFIEGRRIIAKRDRDTFQMWRTQMTTAVL